MPFSVKDANIPESMYLALFLITVLVVTVKSPPKQHSEKDWFTQNMRVYWPTCMMFGFLLLLGGQYIFSQENFSWGSFHFPLIIGVWGLLSVIFSQTSSPEILKSAGTIFLGSLLFYILFIMMYFCLKFDRNSNATYTHVIYGIGMAIILGGVAYNGYAEATHKDNKHNRSCVIWAQIFHFLTILALCVVFWVRAAEYDGRVIPWTHVPRNLFRRRVSLNSPGQNLIDPPTSRGAGYGGSGYGGNGYGIRGRTVVDLDSVL